MDRRPTPSEKVVTVRKGCSRHLPVIALMVLITGAAWVGEPAVAQPALGQTAAFDVRGVPLSKALGRAADVLRLDLAFAPEAVEGETSGCVTRVSAAGATVGQQAGDVLRCVLRGTGLEARRLTSGAFVIVSHAEALSSRHMRSSGVIRGVVRDRASGTTLTGVNVVLKETHRGDATGGQGAFQVDRVPPGRYVVVATRIGFQPARVGPLRVTPGDTLSVSLTLAETTIPLEQLVVTSSLGTPFVSEVAQALPTGYQSIGLGGVNIGLLMSADASGANAQFSPLGNLAGTSLHGLQFSGGVNAAGGSAAGVQVAGVGNLAGADLRGMQFGGAVNAVGRILRGVQLSGVANFAYGEALGVQFGGTVNVAGRLSGGQFAGAANVSAGSMRGVQVAGGLNVAREAMRGVQVAGVVNVAGGPVAGAQVAALLNVADAVGGLQLGLVNVAQKNTGVPIGFFSYVGDVGLRYDTWVGETGMTTVALRSGNRLVSNFVGVGFRPQGETYPLAAIAGLGVERMPAQRLSIGLDVLSYWLIDIDGKDFANLAKLRLTLGYDVGGGVGLFAGPTVNLLVAADEANDLAPWTWAAGRLGSTPYRLWPGFVVGLQLSR